MDPTNLAHVGSSDLTGLEDILADFPAGPLDTYRKRASFDWKRMRLFLEGEDILKFKHRVWSCFEKDPLFAQSPWQELSRDEQRRISFIRLKRLFEYNFVTEEDMIENPMLVPAYIQCLAQYDLSLAARKFLSLDYFVQSARTSGSKQHVQFIRDVKAFNVMGALSITELAHGSNISGIRTRATFDHKTNEFIMHTPDLEATKVWSGILGTTATHAVVFAQLYTPDGHCHGVHQFLTPIRDPKTLLPFKCVKVGDMGQKLGMNGNDNGFMQFDNYRIPKDSLMNKNADVTDEGKYILRQKDKQRRQGVTLGVLSMGRIGIVYLGVLNLQQALTIAVRYSALRKQFGPKDQEEWPVIEYQSQQWRLFPYIAASYVHRHFYFSLQKDFMAFYADIAYGFKLIPEAEQGNLGAEIHALTSSSKPCVGWVARDGIQQCRECCGGHGYLKASRIGELRDDHDPNLTHEGECYVMFIQTSNYLLKRFQDKLNNGTPVHSPLGSINFIDNYEVVLRNKMLNKNLKDIKAVIGAYEFLVCYLLVESNLKLGKELVKHKECLYAAKSQSQIYFLQSLAAVYFELESIRRFEQFLNDSASTLSEPYIVVLRRLLELYGLWSLEKHIATLYEGDYFPPRYELNPTRIVREHILELCDALKDDAVALVDTFAPPDFVLNSCLGYSDGRVYEHVFEALSKSKGAFDRPAWYKEFTERKPNIDSLRSPHAKL
ncbi:Peroxisomal acyl-coenzyme A oxidase 3 [Halotydeus destructor]|nr:Peroxisomal acyl-coenzyme A oxidase 3 [Halotydeus destructor]